MLWERRALPRRFGRRRFHPRLRALLLLHRRKPSCLHESHDITSHATVSILLCQQLRLLVPSLKETPTLACHGVRGIIPFPEHIVINWMHHLLRVERAVAPSFVVSPSVAELKPSDKNNERHDKQYRQNTRTDQQPLHLESFLLDLSTPRDRVLLHRRKPSCFHKSHAPIIFCTSQS